MRDENCTNIDNVCEDAGRFGDLSRISPNQLATLANLVAVALSEGRSSSEINVIGNFVVGVGSLMLTIAAQTEALSSKENKMKQISDLKKQIQQLEDSLKK